MPKSLKFCTPSMYADDTEIYASVKDGDEVVTNINSDLENVRKWMLQDISFKFIQQRQNLCIFDHMYIKSKIAHAEPNFN